MGTTGIIIANLGSPESPSPHHVGKFLNEFLTDPYVVNLPSPLRQILVRGFITPFRRKSSAAAYQAIWDCEEGPLRRNTRQIALSVEQLTGLTTVVGMRYGSPSIHEALHQLHDYEQVVLALLYPQHADSTRTTTIEHTRRLTDHQHLTILPTFFQESGYLDALVTKTQQNLDSDIEHLIVSFHSLPERHLRITDPTKTHCLIQQDCCNVHSPAHATCYRFQCIRTAEALGKRIGLPISITFQSRLGRAKWLEPATTTVIDRCAAEGLKKIAVVCPSFIVDNLETLEEIEIQGKQQFLDRGGSKFQLISCLNNSKPWLNFLADFITQHIA